MAIQAIPPAGEGAPQVVKLALDDLGRTVRQVGRNILAAQHGDIRGVVRADEAMVGTKDGGGRASVLMGGHLAQQDACVAQLALRKAFRAHVLVGGHADEGDIAAGADVASDASEVALGLVARQVVDGALPAAAQRVAQALADGADHGARAARVAVLAADGQAGDGALHEAVDGQVGLREGGLVDRARGVALQARADAGQAKDVVLAAVGGRAGDAIADEAD